MHDGTDGLNVSRRSLLRASAGAASLSSVGSARGAGDDSERHVARAIDLDCPDATLEPGMTDCKGTTSGGCTDESPATNDLRSAVTQTLEDRYPDVGTLIDAGYKPYFDTLEGGDDGWSHWLSPDRIGDAAVLDPDRPESVLVDNESWRSIGVMFIATRDGEPVEPPAVYEADESTGRCSPWHAHTGLPGRFAWWYYRQAYERDFAANALDFPCRTPCMLHVWSVDHPESVYAHDAPPAAYRDRQPADGPGFDTDAAPGEDELGWDVLPDDLVPELTPDDFSPSDILDLAPGHS
ncbi:hypothetical protein [Natrinema halophilum]|uniref:Uncharacterized protein n=1 Tax=Natrinema halophilum TaxID=1699371 RepID=A0A7D5H476_9EURY|nr:hypothetical protein [Natrinema halophilum]QLG50391.1 hypothetical protein HYG82_16825 [Natrinema halophilum]